jgi:uncharacterized membrane-anchored protein YhcB (DUF1043 family)
MTATLWLWLLLAFVAGGVAGVLLANRRRHDANDSQQLAKLQSELDSYREEVTEHFVKTAHLVNELTHSYKAVYDHLEKGAYTLVDSETLHRRLEKVEAEPVMLEYIGQRRAVEAHTPLATTANASPNANPAEATGEVEGRTEVEPAFVGVKPAREEAEEKHEEANASATDEERKVASSEERKRASERQSASAEKREREPQRIAN